MIAKARTNPLNLCAMPNTLECSINPDSYTHLTLPTNSLV